MDSLDSAMISSDSGRQSYVFGPVSSRRLGQSLGIDPIPLKTCNWNCVYCQLGRTVPLRHRRRDYSPVDAVVSEVEAALSEAPRNSIDWVTLVGSGETLLHASIGALIRGVKSLTGLPLAVITNGSLLGHPDVRDELLLADAVLPSLDAGTTELFRRINRPHPSLSFKQHVSGLQAFRKVYRGKLFLELMLLKDLNDSEEALESIASCVRTIEPDELHLSLPDRPPAEPWVGPPPVGRVLRAMEILGGSAKVLEPLDGIIHLSSKERALENILSVIARHPLSDPQLLEALSDWTETDRSLLLAELEECGRATRIRRKGTDFWVSASTRFPKAE